MAATRRLAGRVAVDGRWYGPSDDVPADVAEKITNPKAWTRDLDDDDTDASVTLPKGGTAAGAKLAGRVAVNGRWYGPGDAIPDDVAAQITNPKAWEGGKLPTVGGNGDDSDDGEDVDKAEVSARQAELTAEKAAAAAKAEADADADKADAAKARKATSRK